VVSPDVGGVERAREFARSLDTGLVIIDKRRPKPNEAVVYNIIGDVKDCTAIILDDIVDTAGTLTKVAVALKEKGARHIFAACTHAVLSGSAIDIINKSPLEKLFVTDTIHRSDGLGSKIEVLSVAHILAEAVRRNHEGMSISEMFEKQ